MTKGDRSGCAKKLDIFELCARDRLASVVGPMERLDCGGGPEGLPGFKVHLPGGGLAVVEVTGETDEAQQALDAASARFFGSLRLDGSAWRWMITPAADAELKRISREDLLRLMTDMEAADRQSVARAGGWPDPFAQRARALKIDSIYGWPAAAGAGRVTPGSGMFGGWEWNGAATSGGSAATWRIRSDSRRSENWAVRTRRSVTWSWSWIRGRQPGCGFRSGWLTGRCRAPWPGCCRYSLRQSP